MALKIFNTMTRRKEEFVPLKPHFVRMYTCGLTVYDYMHIGHARTYCFWDVLRRWLRHSGYQVVSVINYTDIEDKIIARSNESGIPVENLSERFIKAFDRDIKWLGIEPWTIDCRASEFVQEMIEMVKALIEKGFGYVVEGDVFFSVEKFRGYGKLSGHNLDDLIAGSRVEVDERKKNPADFALWKSAKPGEPFWESPWGKGRPGWHIECSVMSMNFLGETFDIHGGAVDNMFPHHENEIAQSESYTGKPFAKYWMHPEHLLMEGTKMSKSLGNFVTVHDLREQKVDPRAVRLYFLMNHYLTQMNFSDEGLEAAAAALDRIRQFFSKVHQAEVTHDKDRGEQRLSEGVKQRTDGLLTDVVRSLDDDLNTPAALAAVFELIRDVNADEADYLANYADASHISISLALPLFVLGIGVRVSDLVGSQSSDLGPLGDHVVGDFSELFDIYRLLAEHEVATSKQLISQLVHLREDARTEGNYQRADEIRNVLVSVGVILEDTPSGTRWHLSPQGGAPKAE